MITSEQLCAARAMLRLDRKGVADGAGVSLSTVKRMETETGELEGRVSTIRALQSFFEQRGVQFVPENGGGAGVRFSERSGDAS